MLKKILFLLLLTPLTAIACNNNGGNGEVTLDTPLFFECCEGSTTIKYVFYNISNASSGAPNLEYSYNLNQWKPVDIQEGEGFTIDVLNKGQKMYFRGDNSEGFNSPDSFFSFQFVDSAELKLNISGNVMSLLSTGEYANAVSIPNDFCFAQLFFCFNGEEESVDRNDFGNVDASRLLLPATDLKKYAYGSMFSSASLSKAPLLLPAEVAKEGVYNDMFYINKHLVNTPTIRIKNLERQACREMFCNCLELDISKGSGGHEFFTCPKINGEECVINMFGNTKTPDLPNPVEGEVYYFN